ncbi:unnamed protein product, partial [Vitis vinifera]
MWLLRSQIHSPLYRSSCHSHSLCDSGSYSSRLLVLLLLLLSCFVSSHQACHHLDRASLLSFSRDISSPPSAPLNWSSFDCCLWEGITCYEGRVTHLRLPLRGLSGGVSPSLANLTLLSHLNLSRNSFSGSVPLELFSSLEILDVSFNRLSGELPLSLLMDFSYNKFSGRVPLGLGDCSKLEVLRAGFNSLSGLIPEDIYSAAALREISLPLIGNLPKDMGKLFYLKRLLLHINKLTGPLPASLMNCTKLTTLNLRVNLFEGDISRLPDDDSILDSNGFQRLQVLGLGGCRFTGQVPTWLAKLSKLEVLDLNNSLSGNIPTEIGQLKFIHILDLSYNNFSGSIPDQISNLTNLEKLDLSGNHLSGEIPGSLRSLHFLSSFNVANNSLEGAIPSGGQFDTFPNSSFEGNPGLCGPPLQRSCSNQPGTTHSSTLGKSLNKKLIVGLIVGICFVTGLILALLTLWICKRRILPRGESEKSNLDTISCTSNTDFHSEVDKDTSMVIVFPSNTNGIKDLTISEIFKATDNFNQENIIGCGGFGLVYKAILENGTKLAIKKLSGDLGLIEREFKAEVEALSTAQHKNLVSLQGYCVHDGIRLLIYSYMENGSLDYWLHEKTDGSPQLDWRSRLKIAQGASCGLAYMHQICEPHIVHRDIKSSNILLNDKFEAHVADFGLSRLILPYHTHVTTELVGTLGYIPPEYGQAWVATLRGDVYSFGVVMLELLTGKRPVEVFKPKMSRELVGWVQQMRSEGKQDQVFDPLLRGKGFEEEMLQVLDVACMCVSQNPFKRPTIKEVVNWLENVGNNPQAPK